MASVCEFHKCMIKSIKKWQMASVCELQNSKKTANGFGMRISKNV